MLLQSRAATTVKGESSTSTVEPRLLTDPNVLWVGTFDDPNWEDLWGLSFWNAKANTSVNTFSGISDQGKAFRGVTPTNSQLGFGVMAGFVNMGPGTGAGIPEQEVAHLRYRVNFPSDYVWTNASGGGHGKLPGLAGKATGGEAWAVSGGGKRWNGTTMINRLEDLEKADGWSARLLWMKDKGATVYLYTPDRYGKVSGTPGTDTFRAFGTANRLKTDPYNSASANMQFSTGWNTIEESVKMNTPGVANGELKIWMNGKLGLDMKNIMFRSSLRPNLKITQAWWTWYYGGPTTDYPDRNSYVYFDDVAVSKAYIGPRQAGSTTPPPNQPPVPNITPSFSTTTGTVADIYSCSSSDPDGDPITHAWSIVSQPSGSNIALTKVSSCHVQMTPTVAGSYVVRVTVTDSKGASASKETTVTVTSSTTPPPDTTPPSVPSGVTASSSAYNKVNVSWTASTDNVGVTGYTIWRSTGTSTPTAIASVASTTTTYSDTSVSASTTYSYSITAKDAAGNVSPSSTPASVTTPSSPDTTAPSAPTNLTATPVSTSQINLAWSASTDNVAVTGYEVWRVGSSGDTKLATVTTTSFGDSGLSASTTYSYYVKARDAANNVSGSSTTISTTTKSPSTVTTGTLTGRLVSSAGDRLRKPRISLVWGGSTHTYAPSSTGSYTITGIPAGSYQVTYSAQKHTSQTLSVTITANTSTTKDVSLVKN